MMVPFVDVGVDDLHVFIGSLDGFKSQRAIQGVGVLGDKAPSAKALDIWVIKKDFHEPSPKALALVRFQDVYIAEIPVRGVVRHGPGESNLAIFLKESRTKRMHRRFGGELDGNLL